MLVAWLVRTGKPLYNGHLGDRGHQVLKKGTADILLGVTLQWTSTPTSGG